MKMSQKRWLLAIGIGLVAGAVAFYLLPLIIVSAVSAVVASLVTIAVYRVLDSKKTTDQPAKPDPRKELRARLDGLVELNIRIREEGLGDQALSRFEGIIDKLRELLPGINQRYPTHELTWTLNQMAKEYLPKGVNPFVALSALDRDERQAELMTSLDGLEAEVDNVAELIRGDKLGDFKAKAAFLRARFVQGV